MPRSRTGVRSADDAAGDMHAITRDIIGEGASTAALTHISASKCCCGAAAAAAAAAAANTARVWTEQMAVLSTPASTTAIRSDCAPRRTSLLAADAVLLGGSATLRAGSRTVGCTLHSGTSTSRTTKKATPMVPAPKSKSAHRGYGSITGCSRLPIQSAPVRTIGATCTHKRISFSHAGGGRRVAIRSPSSILTCAETRPDGYGSSARGRYALR